METNKPLSIHHSNMIQQLHDNSISVVDMTNPYILPPIYSHIVVPVKSETSLFLQPTLNNSQQEQLDNTIDTTTTVSSLTTTPKSKTVVYSMEQTPIKKRKAKSSSSNNSKASSSVDSDTKTTSTSKHKTKKRKTTSDSNKIVTSNSSALCSPSTNDSSTSSSTITVQKVVKENQSSPKKNRNTNEGLQPSDSRALAEFSKHLSELNEKEMERSINFLLPRYKIDFLKTLISSCKSKSSNYLNNYRKSHNKSQMLTEILSEKSETLNLIKLFIGNEENESSNNTIVHNETDRNDNVINKVESTIDSNEVNNNNTHDTNEMNESIIENQQVSNNNELDCQSYYDITLDLIQSNYLPYSFNVDNLHNQTDNTNTNNSNNNTHTNNNTTNNNNNNTSTNNIVDDSFCFSDFLDCNDENDKSKQDLINDLTRQLNEKDQQIIELNRMFQEQECYNQNLLNIIQTFKNNLNELEMNYHFI